MTESEKKQIKVMLGEQKRRAAIKIAAQRVADPKGDGLPLAALWKEGQKPTIAIHGKMMTVDEASEIALAEIFEHGGGHGIACYDYSAALFELLKKILEERCCWVGNCPYKEFRV